MREKHPINDLKSALNDTLEIGDSYRSFLLIGISYDWRIFLRDWRIFQRDHGMSDGTSDRMAIRIFDTPH